MANNDTNKITADGIFENYKDAWVSDTNLDTIDLNASKPELTTIFIGPPRMVLVDSSSNQKGPFVKINAEKGLADYSGTEKIAGLIPFGAAESIQWSISRQQMPLGAIGTANKTFASSDSTLGTLSFNTLVVPDSFLKIVVNFIGKIEGYKGLQPSTNYSSIYELDTILAEIPIGILVVEYNKTGKALGKHYFEMCKIQGAARGVQTGQAVSFDSVQFMFHRIKSLGGTNNP